MTLLYAIASVHIVTLFIYRNLDLNSTTFKAFNVTLYYEKPSSISALQ